MSTQTSAPPTRRRTSAVGSWFGLVLVAVLGLAVAAPAPASATDASPSTLVAPYMDMGGYNPGMLATALSGPLNDFTAGFVLGNGCTPIWDDYQATPATGDNVINDRVDNAGGSPIISFGGADGADLAITCPQHHPANATDVANLVHAYQLVIDRFGANRVDFDVEGSALDDIPSIDARFAAINVLKTNGINPGLQVSVTLPVDGYGFADDGLRFLDKAKAAGVDIDLVNIMAMEFTKTTDVGGSTKTAAANALSQMKVRWPAFTYANLGITPMIGHNITAGESLSLDDAKVVVDFAREKKVGRLAFWALNRDRQCTNSADDQQLASCSRVSQSTLAFTNAFLAVHSSSK